MGAMKTMKSAMKGGMKKAAMKKGMKVSKIAKNKRAKASVFRGRKEKTISGLTKATLMKSKTGKIVSKKQSAAAKKRFVNSAAKRWTDAVKKARKELGIKGFCAVGGKTAQGKALYAKAKSLLA